MSAESGKVTTYEISTYSSRLMCNPFKKKLRKKDHYIVVLKDFFFPFNLIIPL